MSSRSDSALEHVAEHLQYIASAGSFWFTLNSNYTHGCHLANRFGLNQEEYEALLIICGLASYTRYGFTIKPTAWSNFIGGHWFVTSNTSIGLIQYKIDIDALINGTEQLEKERKKVYAVRIREKTKESANKYTDQLGTDGKIITDPPRRHRRHWRECNSFKKMCCHSYGILSLKTI
jgi:hypothetical protein